METNILFFLAISFGFIMAWGIGANDVANAMGTSVGSRALTIKQALVIAAFFECAGALLAGGQVTDTIRDKIIDIELLSSTPELVIYGMLASLLAAGIWLVVASWQGWPVSTTHSIVGAIIGFGVVNLGMEAVHWNKVTAIVMSWVVTPVMAGGIAYFVFISLQKIILNSSRPLLNAKRCLPIYIFFMALIVCLVTLFKGLKYLNLELTGIQGFGLSVLISGLITSVGYFALRPIPDHHISRRKTHYLIEKIFAILVIFTACAVAFSHGSNDVANAIGPLSAIVSLLEDGQKVAQKTSVPFWALALGALGIVTGLATYGYRVIITVGKKITHLTPSRAFAAEIATASTVVIASGAGLPISTTQTLVGAVLGVGFAGGISAIRLDVIRNIFMSWVITLPAGALLAIIFFYALRLLH